MSLEARDETPISASASRYRRESHEKHVKITGHGAAEDGEPFVEVSIDESPILIKVNNLLDTRSRNTEFARLQNRGAVLLKKTRRDDLINDIVLELSKKPSFSVATNTGWYDGLFVFPDAVVPRNWSYIETYFEDDNADVYSRYLCAGDRAGAHKLFKLFRGNSRLILGTCLAFVGPIASILGLEHVGLQFVGPRGIAKSSAATIITAVWGWDANPDHRLGFGTSWKSTENALENYAAACNATLLFLDETDSVPGANAVVKHHAILNSIKDIAGGKGKARANDLGVKTWFTPLLSTSNESVVEMLAVTKRSGDQSYIDRLFDIPPPKLTDGGDGFFENLHGSATKVEFRDRLFMLAAEHHGKAGRAFVRNIAQELVGDPDELKAFVGKRRAYYLDPARRIEAPGRDPGRLHGKFATLYAAGCLAAHFGILPLTGKEIREALLTCERDHVEFVAAEMTKWFVPPASSGGQISTKPNVADRPFSYGEFKDRVFGKKREKLIDLATNDIVYRLHRSS
jgi:uncharacterized protein (DUF927 family)